MNDLGKVEDKITDGNSKNWKIWMLKNYLHGLNHQELKSDIVLVREKGSINKQKSKKKEGILCNKEFGWLSFLVPGR